MAKHDDAPPDFELKKYELDRAHELELNKFAHALEVERLKILQLVNGGAFTVLVVFATGLVASPRPSPALAILAGVSWVLGLGAAAWATQRQLQGQAKFNQAYRLRRNAVEFVALGRTYGAAAAAAMLPPLDATAPGASAKTERKPAEKARDPKREDYDGQADAAFYDGKNAGKYVKKMAMASIVLFMLGGLSLAASLATADPAKLERGEKAAH